MKRIAFIVCALIAAPGWAQALDLTLADVVREGVKRNLTLEGGRLALQRDVAGNRSARATYSPTLLFNTDVRNDRPDVTSPLFNYSAGAAWFTPIGTELAATAGV